MVDTVTYIEEATHILYLVDTEPETDVIVGNDTQAILIKNSLADIEFPAQLIIDSLPSEENIASAGVIILPLSGGGRGPVINNGEVISTGLLLELLTAALTEGQLSAELLEQLASIPAARANSREQSGYATHNTAITLSHNWSGLLPKITFNLAPGSIVHHDETVVGIDPDCVTYLEFNKQEVLYGHSGIAGNNFTVKAATLKKSTPIDKILNWISSNVSGPPLLSNTTESVATITTAACMGLRVKGIINLSNSLAYGVSGTMYVQMSVDSGAWINIAGLFWKFDDNDSGNASENFDVLLVHDQASHTYKFRGQLITDSDDELNRELTGSIQVDTVRELGSGTIISNDLQLQWSSKE